MTWVIWVSPPPNRSRNLAPFLMWLRPIKSWNLVPFFKLSANNWKSSFGTFFQCVCQQLKVEIWSLFSNCLPTIESRNLVPFFNVSANNWKSKFGTFFQCVCQQLKVEIWYLFKKHLFIVCRKVDNCRVTPEGDAIDRHVFFESFAGVLC